MLMYILGLSFNVLKMRGLLALSGEIHPALRMSLMDVHIVALLSSLPLASKVFNLVRYDIMTFDLAHFSRCFLSCYVCTRDERSPYPTPL